MKELCWCSYLCPHCGRDTAIGLMSLAATCPCGTYIADVQGGGWWESRKAYEEGEPKIAERTWHRESERAESRVNAHVRELEEQRSGLIRDNANQTDEMRRMMEAMTAAKTQEMEQRQRAEDAEKRVVDLSEEIEIRKNNDRFAEAEIARLKEKTIAVEQCAAELELALHAEHEVLDELCDAYGEDLTSGDAK
jgi:hypothetical protein